MAFLHMHVGTSVQVEGKGALLGRDSNLFLFEEETTILLISNHLLYTHTCPMRCSIGLRLLLLGPATAFTNRIELLP
jgi:hypothetical protein